MIVTPLAGELQTILQTDHARLSGSLAEQWGNGAFARLEPYDSMCMAARRHDDGWAEYESLPRVNPKTGRPYQFTELAVREHLSFYWHGVEQVAARDAYAGLMVSMHCEGLYNGRYGIDPGVAAPTFTGADREVVEAFRERLEAQQKRLREQLREDGAAETVRDRVVWANYKLLQIFDRLSLYLCMPPLQPKSLGPAPVDYAGREDRLTLQPGDGGRVHVTPYPFAVTPLHVSVAGRFIPDRRYDSDAEVRGALARARVESLAFELTG
jgi:hypothetical protein